MRFEIKVALCVVFTLAYLLRCATIAIVLWSEVLVTEAGRNGHGCEIVKRGGVPD